MILYFFKKIILIFSLKPKGTAHVQPTPVKIKQGNGPRG